MRRDALPEYTTYRDTGCHVAPRCTPDKDGNGGCPLAYCIFDEPRRRRREERLVTAHLMLRLLQIGHTPQELADRFGVSKRSVFRYLLMAANVGTRRIRQDAVALQVLSA